MCALTWVEEDVAGEAFFGGSAVVVVVVGTVSLRSGLCLCSLRVGVLPMRGHLASRKFPKGSSLRPVPRVTGCAWCHRVEQCWAIESGEKIVVCQSVSQG